MRKKNNDVIAIEVHWYAASTHPFNGVYKPEMVVEKHVNRKRKRDCKNTTLRHIDLLKLDGVDMFMNSI